MIGFRKKVRLVQDWEPVEWSQRSGIKSGILVERSPALKGIEIV